MKRIAVLAALTVAMSAAPASAAVLDPGSGGPIDGYWNDGAGWLYDIAMLSPDGAVDFTCPIHSYDLDDCYQPLL